VNVYETFFDSPGPHCIFFIRQKHPVRLKPLMLNNHRSQVAQKEILMPALPIATTSFIRPRKEARQGEINLGGLSARLAIDRKTRGQVFALRHTSYLAGGYIEPRPHGQFSDPFDDAPNCTSLLVLKHDVPVASVRLCTLDFDPAKRGWDNIPGLHVFEDEILKLVKPGADGGTNLRATEINRLVRHPDHVHDYELVFVLFRFVSYLVLRQQFEMTLSCVRRNHISFYKRLGFEVSAGPRAYPELKFSTNLMVCPRTNYDMLRQRYPILDHSAVQSGCYDGLFHGETVNVFGDK
jgi:hypothetical protein